MKTVIGKGNNEGGHFVGQSEICWFPKWLCLLIYLFFFTDITKEFNETFYESDFIGKEEEKQVEMDDDYIDVEKIYKE